MIEFVFMLTHHDRTVERPADVYDSIRDCGLRYVGFKDVGASVKELQEALGHNQALVSHHLRLLREQGIVTSVARGRSNVYQIHIDPLACLAQCLGSMVSPDDPACACPAPSL